VGLKNWMAAILLLVLLAGGCDEPGDQVEMEVGKSYTPSSSDVLNRLGGIENLEQFEAFYENVQKGQEDSVRIVSYTVEGDPIIQDLEYDGETIHSIEDSRMDAYGTGEVAKMDCKRIEFTSDRGQNVYNLKACNKNEYNKTVLWYE
jgi:hypothetical protein